MHSGVNKAVAALGVRDGLLVAQADRKLLLRQVRQGADTLLYVSALIHSGTVKLTRPHSKGTCEQLLRLQQGMAPGCSAICRNTLLITQHGTATDLPGQALGVVVQDVGEVFLKHARPHHVLVARVALVELRAVPVKRVRRIQLANTVRQ